MRFNPQWRTQYQSRLTASAQAVADIKRGQRVFIGSGAAEPQALVAALAARSDYLADNQLIHIRSLGVSPPYTESKFSDRFRYNTFFIGDNVRGAVAEGRADYTPIFLSEVPGLFRSGKAPVDVALIVLDRICEIDAEGVIIPVAGRAGDIDLPVITGMENGDPASLRGKEGIGKALEILSLLKQY